MRKTLLLCLLALPVAAQTDTIVAGVAGDSSVVAPVVSWNRTQADGDTLSLGLTGWTISGELTRRRNPRSRGVVSLAVTPLNAYSGDRMYVNGVRAPELEFDASAVEATFGRVDPLSERWTSDVRLVVLSEKIDDVNANYAGLRTRQAWRRITAEDPLLMTFDGSEVSATAEVFAGSDTWSRIRLDQRFSRRWGRVRAGESVTAFHGHSLNTAHAFLIGTYGYRYAELRLDRGVGVDVNLSYALTPSIALGAHAGALHSRELDARGAALDVTASWKGIGFRFGVAQADGDRDVVLYGSILAARFLR